MVFVLYKRTFNLYSVILGLLDLTIEITVIIIIIKLLIKDHTAKGIKVV